MEKYTTQEKIQICTEIVTNLKNFKGKDNTPVNLFNESYDDAVDVEKRLEIILDNFKNYKKIPYDPITLEKLSHNHNHFFNVDLIKQRVLDEIVYPILEWVETKQ